MDKISASVKSYFDQNDIATPTVKISEETIKNHAKLVRRCFSQEKHRKLVRKLRGKMEIFCS